MNISIVRYILGNVLKIEAGFLLFPCITALVYHEREGFAYLIAAAICFLVGLLVSLKKPKSMTFYQKEGFAATALSWIFLSIFGCIPFMMTGEIPRFCNALFEAASGFSTTGASILDDVEAMSQCTLLWRSLTHWIGGMGILVFLMAIVPTSGGTSNFNLMRAESTGASVGKLVPKGSTTARILYLIYLGLSVLQFLFLLFGGTPVFDSINIALATAGTGGFGLKGDSLTGYSTYVQWVTIVFMILFGVSFNTYYCLLFRKWKNAVTSEVRWYFIIILAAVIFLSFQIYDSATGVFNAITTSSFQVAAMITTTGFSTADFDAWSQSARLVMVGLMFLGACAGSTGGGMKVSRITLLVRTVGKELSSLIHPNSVKKIEVDHKPVEHEVVRAVNVYMVAFFLIFAVSMFAVSFNGMDFTSTFTAVLACLNNIGPGLNMVGPTQNFGFLSAFSKYVLIFDMIAGRLELFPMLILFTPALWRDTVTRQRNIRRQAHPKNTAATNLNMGEEEK